MKEQSIENMARGRKVYEPARYMSLSQAASQLIETEEHRKEGICEANKMAIGVSRLGAQDQQIVVGNLSELTGVDLGNPLHSLVLIGHRVHELEVDFLRYYALNKVSFNAWTRTT